MKSQRPYRRARPDGNHKIVINALKNWGGGFARDEFGVWQGHVHGLPVAAYDTNKLGGQLPDWIVAISWLVVGFEVKTPRPPESDLGRPREMTDHAYYWSMLKPGEKAYFTHSPMIKFVAATEEEVWTKIVDAVRFVEWVDSLPLAESFLNLFFPKTREESQDELFDKTFE